MAQQSKAESFSAYLGAWEKSKPSAPDSSAGPLALLQALAAADQKQMAVNDLLTATGLTIIDLAASLTNLKQSGYLTLNGSGSAEVAKLTPLGEDVSRLADSKK